MSAEVTPPSSLITSSTEYVDPLEALKNVLEVRSAVGVAINTASYVEILGKGNNTSSITCTTPFPSN